MGFKLKTFCGRGMDIFWNNTINTSQLKVAQNSFQHLDFYGSL